MLGDLSRKCVSCCRHLHCGCIPASVLLLLLHMLACCIALTRMVFVVLLYCVHTFMGWHEEQVAGLDTAIWLCMTWFSSCADWDCVWYVAGFSSGFTNQRGTCVFLGNLYLLQHPCESLVLFILCWVGHPARIWDEQASRMTRSAACSDVGLGISSTDCYLTAWGIPGAVRMCAFLYFQCHILPSCILGDENVIDSGQG
jgi:hypothetical protein